MKDCKDIVSVESYFLGKKCYIDRIRGDVLTTINVDGPTYKYDYHIRMKGVGDKAIKYYCEQNNITPMELYKQLYENKTIDIDTSANGTIARFKHLNKVSIKTLKPEECMKKIKFLD
jgi:hypothetical protein